MCPRNVSVLTQWRAKVTVSKLFRTSFDWQDLWLFKYHSSSNLCKQCWVSSGGFWVHMKLQPHVFIQVDKKQHKDFSTGYLSQFWFVSLCPVCFIQFGFSSHWQFAFGHNCLPAYIFSSCIKSFTWESQHSQIALFSFWGKYILMMLFSRLWAFRQRWIECKQHWEKDQREEKLVDSSPTHLTLSSLAYLGRWTEHCHGNCNPNCF